MKRRLEVNLVVRKSKRKGKQNRWKNKRRK